MLGMSQQRQNMFLFLDCCESNWALLHIGDKNSYIYKRDFVMTHDDKSTKSP